jgi:hypothetical protein
MPANAPTVDNTPKSHHGGIMQDSWYNAFVPRTAKAPPAENKHKRRVSLLKQPNVSHHHSRKHEDVERY